MIHNDIDVKNTLAEIQSLINFNDFSWNQRNHVFSQKRPINPFPSPSEDNFRLPPACWLPLIPKHLFYHMHHSIMQNPIPNFESIFFDVFPFPKTPRSVNSSIKLFLSNQSASNIIAPDIDKGFTLSRSTPGREDNCRVVEYRTLGVEHMGNKRNFESKGTINNNFLDESNDDFNIDGGTKDSESSVLGKHNAIGTEGDNKEGVFYCHICEYKGNRHDVFLIHLRGHYDYKCTQCDYASRTEGRLKRHIKDFHSNVPPKNFSGQKTIKQIPKCLKCKHCNFISGTKDQHWHHQRLHLQPNKYLECPKCPFITEYKHHLEYHLRNHVGSKPYKCPKCNYQCVNKSMLNSHMKSHTSVYQYRCADCNYATKYCHSLKLHLIKQNHNPASVLNPDGSLPFYDNSAEILSAKRGPQTRRIVNSPTIVEHTLMDCSHQHSFGLSVQPHSYENNDNITQTDVVDLSSKNIVRDGSSSNSQLKML